MKSKFKTFLARNFLFNIMVSWPAKCPFCPGFSVLISWWIPPELIGGWGWLIWQSGNQYDASSYPWSINHGQLPTHTHSLRPTDNNNNNNNNNIQVWWLNIRLWYVPIHYKWEYYKSALRYQNDYPKTLNHKVFINTIRLRRNVSYFLKQNFQFYFKI